MVAFRNARLENKFDLLIVATGAPAMKRLTGLIARLNAVYDTTRFKLVKFITFCVLKVSFKVYEFAFNRVFLARNRIMARPGYY
ncbi:hypothetical protein PEE20_16015 [Salmonella enterica subsp. enterica serovar Bispebjerg]|uniref:hypothetical protein n=1 Tax=Salmonella enterica TaxID=28901 RepID=UPI001DC4640D|nr:hypothetical protein [Salmonella enterica]EGX3499970.1 hypothetical protein [Salmonella enterica]EIS3892276.1 hypothetical protein [Salmonella enterica]WBQ81065.1 hypothetical protein PEE20_16015 [Salmonella enterica subsp. enterica serovar Bispebjerg]HBZ9863963.1 hypothetical protein [Salmonella enterica subsp. houtenae]